MVKKVIKGLGFLRKFSADPLKFVGYLFIGALVRDSLAFQCQLSQLFRYSTGHSCRPQRVNAVYVQVVPVAINGRQFSIDGKRIVACANILRISAVWHTREMWSCAAIARTHGSDGGIC